MCIVYLETYFNKTRAEENDGAGRRIPTIIEENERYIFVTRFNFYCLFKVFVSFLIRRI